MKTIHKTGLSRIIATPPEQEYLAAQFLGDLPATVPAVLGAELRTTMGDTTGEAPAR